MGSQQSAENDQDSLTSEARLAAEACALAKLNDASSRLWRARTLQEGLDEMLAATIELLGADMGNIQILDSQRNILLIAAQRGFKQDFLDFIREVSPDDDSACGRALRLGERILIEDVETDPFFAPSREVARAAGYRAVQSTPLLGRDGAPLGIISTHFRVVHRPSEQDLRRLDLYARQAAGFIERCKIDEALKKSERRFRLTADAAPVMIWRSGIDKLCTWFNKPWLDFVGRTMEHEVGNGWSENVHPDDFDRCLKTYIDAFDARETFSMEYRLRRHDGEYRWVLDNGIPLWEPAGEFAGYIGSCIDITDRKRAEEQQGVLIAELDHRVKNVLASVAAVAKRTSERRGSISGFIEALDRRIQSMADAHALLSSSQWQGVCLADLVRHELAPYATDGNTTVEGPYVGLSAAATQTMAMVLHELATNAAKYGALSTPQGRVSVRWHRLSNKEVPAKLRLEWHEHGGPAVNAPARPGYGTSVIRELLPYELGGTVELDFAAGGVRCAIEIAGESGQDRSVIHRIKSASAS